MVKVIKDKVLLIPNDIKPSSNKFEVLGVLNPAAVRLNDRRILLYVRVLERLKKRQDLRYFYVPRFVGKNNFEVKIDKIKKKPGINGDDFAVYFKNGTKCLTYLNHFRRVYLDKTGINVLKIEQKPSFYGLANDSELGVEDPRIVKIAEKYYLTYVGITRKESISTYLAESNDCIQWKRHGIIFGQQDKDVVLFPEKVNGNYVVFDRPEGSFQLHPPNIWIAFSKDLVYWGKPKAITLSSKTKEFGRVGSGPPPLKTEKGWLLIFHAVTLIHQKGLIYFLKKVIGTKVEEGPKMYCVWAALFDLNNPEKLIARSHHPVLVPRKKAEISSEGKRVIFPTGIIEDGKDILLYSGIGDKSVSVKKITLKDIFKTLE